jgi:hypothetical protein
MRRCSVLVLIAVLTLATAGPAPAQAPIESELVLITPVSKFIHDAALKAFADYAREIFSFYIAGSATEAAALGVILIVVAAVTMLVINRVAGARMGGMFG